MEEVTSNNFSAFTGDRLVARGGVTHIVRAAHAAGGQGLLVFEDATGQPVDLDLRGTVEEALARVSPVGAASPKPARGRPKLGVTAREVTLLPRHWEWLAGQPGGASAALRRLVDQARRDGGDAEATRRMQEAVYRVMTALAGDFPGYEEATRALFAGDKARFDQLTSDWPGDIGDYLRDLTSTLRPPS